MVVIGGNAAGLSAASQARQQKPDWDVIVFEKGPYISYGSCGIPYYIQGLVSRLEQLIIVTPREAVEKRKLDLRMHHTVTAINPVEKTVTVETPVGSRVNESFDYLVIATGAVPITKGISFTPSPYIHTVNNLDDGAAVRQLIEERKPATGAVIGGGYIALEVLEALKARGLETHLIHRREDLTRTFEKELSDLAKAEMEKEGINLNLNRSVHGLEEQNGRVTVHTDRGELVYDLVIVATGVKPESTLARDSGIELGVKDAIRVNEYMQTNYPYIFAAGDCAETRNLITGKPAHVALALKANKEGVIAGLNASGRRETFKGVLGSAVTKFCNLGLARTGLTLGEAEKEGFAAVKFTFTNYSRAQYYPGGGTITMILIADKKDGRLLGAQMAGPLDSVKRIDVYAAAITAGFTLDDLYQLDLAYAPPFSPVYDPVVLAGRIGRKKI